MIAKGNGIRRLEKNKKEGRTYISVNPSPFSRIAVIFTYYPTLIRVLSLLVPVLTVIIRIACLNFIFLGL